MRSLLILVSVSLSLSSVQPVAAQSTTALSWLPDATVVTNSAPAPFEFFSFYVTAELGPEVILDWDGLAAFGATFSFPSEISITSIDWFPERSEQTFEVVSTDAEGIEYRVLIRDSCSDPIGPGPVVIAEFTTLLLEPLPAPVDISFVTTNALPPRWDGCILSGSFIAFDDVTNSLITLEPPVPTKRRSWGAVKTLFR